MYLKNGSKQIIDRGLETGINFIFFCFKIVWIDFDSILDFDIGGGVEGNDGVVDGCSEKGFSKNLH